MKSEGRDAFKKRIGSCLGAIPKDLEQIAYFPYLGNSAGVKKYLRESGLPLHKRFKIQSLYRQAGKVKNEKSLVLELISYGLSDDRFKDPFDRINYKEKVEGIPLAFWRNLFSINLALAADNRPWLTKLLRSLGQVSPHLFEVYGLPFVKEERKMVRDYILELLEKLRDRKVDLERVKIVAKKMEQLGRTDEFEEIASELDADWSLSELRGLFRNPLWKDEYFDFWYSLILGRTTQAEIDSKLRSVLDQSLVEKAPFSQLWVFESYLPPDEDVRKILYSRLKERWRRGTLLDTYEVLEILKLPPVKNALAHDLKDFNRAGFQLSRDFFIRLLNSGQSSEFALYQLYSLGDKKSDHLWWLIF